MLELSEVGWESGVDEGGIGDSRRFSEGSTCEDGRERDRDGRDERT